MSGQRSSIAIETSFQEVVAASFPRTSRPVDPAFARKVEAVIKNGPRALGELFLEIHSRIDVPAWLDARLAAYAALDASQLKAIGADRWPERFATINGGRQ